MLCHAYRQLARTGRSHRPLPLTRTAEPISAASEAAQGRDVKEICSGSDTLSQCLAASRAPDSALRGGSQSGRSTRCVQYMKHAEANSGQRCDAGGCAGSAQRFTGSGCSADFTGPYLYLIMPAWPSCTVLYQVRAKGRLDHGWTAQVVAVSAATALLQGPTAVCTGCYKVVRRQLCSTLC